MSPSQRVPNDDYAYADQEVSNVIRMCEENPERVSEISNNTEINNFFNEDGDDNS